MKTLLADLDLSEGAASAQERIETPVEDWPQEEHDRFEKILERVNLESWLETEKFRREREKEDANWKEYGQKPFKRER